MKVVSVSLTVDHITLGNTLTWVTYSCLCFHLLLMNSVPGDGFFSHLERYANLLEVYRYKIFNWYKCISLVYKTMGRKKSLEAWIRKSLNNITLQSPWYTGALRVFLLNKQMDKSMLPITTTIWEETIWKTVWKKYLQWYSHSLNEIFVKHLEAPGP